MNKITLFVLAGLLAASVGGCSSSSDKEETASTDTGTNKSPSPTQPQTTAQETFPPSATDLGNQEVAGLIPATNPDVRVRGSIRGRQDPFAPVALKPQIELKESPENSAESEDAKKSSSKIASVPIIKTAPTKPKANLAEQVIVTGLANLGGIVKVILQAPNEVSKHIEVGQYISTPDGKVLVKRVDLNHYPTPLVILEQNGIEVSKAVGEKAQPTAEVEQQQTLNPSLNNPASIGATWVSNFLSHKLEQTETN